MRAAVRLILGVNEMFMLDSAVLLGQLLATELERDFRKFAGEAERHLVVVVIHRSACVDADIERLVNRHNERNRVRNLLAGSFPAVNGQHAATSLSCTVA